MADSRHWKHRGWGPQLWPDAGPSCGCEYKWSQLRLWCPMSCITAVASKFHIISPIFSSFTNFFVIFLDGHGGPFCFPGGEALHQEPKVVTNGWAEGVRAEVKAMLRAVDARGWSCESYSQRVALLELLEVPSWGRSWDLSQLFWDILGYHVGCHGINIWLTTRAKNNKHIQRL